MGHRVNVARNLHYHNHFSKIVLVFRVLWSYTIQPESRRVASISLGDLPLLILAMYRSIWSEPDTYNLKEKQRPERHKNVHFLSWTLHAMVMTWRRALSHQIEG